MFCAQTNLAGYRFKPHLEQLPFECAATPPEQHAWLAADAAAAFPSRCAVFSTHLSLSLFGAMGIDFDSSVR